MDDNDFLDFVKARQLRRGRHLLPFEQLIVHDLVFDLFLDLEEQGLVIRIYRAANANHRLANELLSIFDSLTVVYQKNRAMVSGILSSLDSKTTIYRLYHSLYIDSRLNPFINSFIDHQKGCKLEDGAAEIYRYQPREEDVQAAVLDHEEWRSFII